MQKIERNILLTLQTLAHIFDSYHGLLGLIGDDEIDVDERLQGHLRYTGSLSELCNREGALRQAIYAERVRNKRLSDDAASLEVSIFILFFRAFFTFPARTINNFCVHSNIGNS